MSGLFKGAGEISADACKLSFCCDLRDVENGSAFECAVLVCCKREIVMEFLARRLNKRFETRSYERLEILGLGVQGVDCGSVWAIAMSIASRLSRDS